MAVGCRIKTVETIPPLAKLAPERSDADVSVRMEDGSASSFVVATPDKPGDWMEANGKGYSFGTPVLFVSRLDKAGLDSALAAMAQDMGGYWMRYYNSLGDLAGAVGKPRPPYGPGRDRRAKKK